MARGRPPIYDWADYDDGKLHRVPYEQIIGPHIEDSEAARLGKPTDKERVRRFKNAVRNRAHKQGKSGYVRTWGQEFFIQIVDKNVEPAEAFDRLTVDGPGPGKAHGCAACGVKLSDIARLRRLDESSASAPASSALSILDSPAATKRVTPPKPEPEFEPFDYEALAAAERGDV